MPYEKVGKNEPVCIADIVPFDIPDSWEWVRLGNISIINGGYAFKSTDYVSEGTRVIRISDFNENGFVNKSIVRHRFDVTLQDFLIKKGNIILCMTGGTVGKSYFVKDIPEPMMTNQRVATIKILKALEDYINLVVLSPITQKVIQDSKNSTNDNISMDTIKGFFIPLPPLQEQQRIVEKLKELEPYINDYDKAYEKIEKLNTDFPDLLKKSILQEAVQGKLVPQDPTDESASVLIEQIRKEKEQLIKDKKIKKDKNESYIFRRDNSHYEKIGKEERCIDDEIPFDIPDSWEWTRLGTITEILRGKGPKYADNTDFRILNQKCVRWGNIDTSFCKTVDKQWFESISKECLTTQKDILINSTGEGTIGRSSAVTSDAINMPYDSHVLLIRPYKCLNKYIEIFINGIEGQAQINRSKGAKTTKQTELGVDKTNNLLIPLPPLNEQQRIVDKVNQLLPQISKL